MSRIIRTGYSCKACSNIKYSKATCYSIDTAEQKLWLHLRKSYIIKLLKFRANTVNRGGFVIFGVYILKTRKKNEEAVTHTHPNLNQYYYR